MSLLNRTSAPLWASVIVILLLCLRVPMSWRKCALGPSVVWIGWQWTSTASLSAWTPPNCSASLLLLSSSWHHASVPSATLSVSPGNYSGCLPFSGASVLPCHHCTPTSTLSPRCSRLYLRICGSVNLSPEAGLPGRRTNILPGLSRNNDAFGFSPPVRLALTAASPTLLAKSFACGWTWPLQVRTFAL